MAKRTLLGQFVDELRKDDSRAYDFICNNYSKFSKAELADIIKECLCVDESLNLMFVSQADVYSAIADNIEEWHEEELEEESEEM